MTKVAFDVDGTLITKSPSGEDIPRYVVINTLIHMKHLGCDIYVWSGSGLDYAKRWTERLGIDHLVTVIQKGSINMDIAFDDEEVALASANVKV